MRRFTWIVVCLCMGLLILSFSCGKDGEAPTGPTDTDGNGKAESRVVETVKPDKEAEVVLPDELTIVVPAGAVSGEKYPDGIEVEVEKVSPEKSEEAFEAYTETAPLAPIYHIDAGEATLEKPVTVRVPVSNVDMPEGMGLDDLQIVTWSDSLSYEYLETTLSDDGGFLEADVIHFSYFTVRIKKGWSFWGGSNFNLSQPLHISFDQGRLEFSNIFSETDVNVYRWLLKQLSYPKSSWINYQVEVIEDDVISTMQVYRIIWYPTDFYDVAWKDDIRLEAGKLYGKSGYQVVHRKDINLLRTYPLMVMEKVIVYDKNEEISDTTETLYEFDGTTVKADGFLSQVFWSDKTSRFLDASLIKDPDAKYFLRIKRKYSGGAGVSNTVTSDKFSPYDIAPTVTLGEPEAVATLQILHPAFTWQSQSVADAHVNHDLLVGIDPDPQNNPDYTIPMGATYLFRNDGVERNPLILQPGVYYWCVRAYTYDGKKERAETYSETRTFRVQSSNVYALSGRILENGAGLSDVSVRIEGTGVDQTATTDSDGNYTFMDLPDGNYEITPTKAGYTFDLANVIVVIADKDEVVQDIIASATGGPVTPGEDITVDLLGGATMEMVWIEPGTFTMGSPSSESGRYDNEGPQHEVTITKGFWLGKYELTQEQWQSVTGTTPWKGQDYAQENPDNSASYMSWNDAQAFIAELNADAGSNVYRLPTEAEWEYSCRAGTTTLWSFGDDESQLGQYAWYRDNAWNVGEKYAHAVGTKEANPWGLYDVHGNVWEWVQDWYGSYSSSSQTDPTGPATGSGRVVRGGDFRGYARYVRSAVRGGISPGFRGLYVGARLLRQSH